MDGRVIVVTVTSTRCCCWRERANIRMVPPGRNQTAGVWMQAHLVGTGRNRIRWSCQPTARLVQAENEVAGWLARASRDGSARVAMAKPELDEGLQSVVSPLVPTNTGGSSGHSRPHSSVVKRPGAHHASLNVCRAPIRYPRPIIAGARVLDRRLDGGTHRRSPRVGQLPVPKRATSGPASSGANATTARDDTEG